MSILRFLDAVFVRGLATLCGLLFAVMLVAILGQVLMRYAFSAPLSWSEELARYTMVWLAMLASALCARKGQHLALISAEMLPPRLRLPLRLIGTVIACAILSVLFWHAWDLAERAIRQRTPGLGLSMSWIYAALPTGFALMILGQLLGLFVPEEPAPAEPAAH
ncbi:TRAP transporter small permease [Ponticoccus alexandrii]|uniref:TRAP transporter small permease protein n=1 Tax=Ponticoccus alexandrii TaxID=1943633 RepID=A0ABX7F4H0_9RHOB|nr:TRAP transporter small permease [Ponticoccus alexandrii]QRF65192.1 TRAP transporter small permease subunit [Ponticoccus alexandrii]